jgi:hypothetical protein
MANEVGTGGQAAVLDLEKYPAAQQLVSRCCEFFAEIEDL